MGRGWRTSTLARASSRPRRSCCSVAVFSVPTDTLGDQSQVDDADTPLDETPEAYAQLIQQGKVRAIGALNCNPKRRGEAAADQQEKRSGAVRESAAALQPLRAGGVRNGVGASLPARKHRRDSLLFAGQRISCGQVPFRSRLAHARARDFREEISERARFQNPGRARASVSYCLSSLGPKVNACKGDVSFVGELPLHQHRPGPISKLGNTLPECNSAGEVYGPRLELVGERPPVPHRSFAPTAMRGIGGGRRLRG